jgi:hypothetical protein
MEIIKRRRVIIFNPTGGTCINTFAESQPLINKDEFKSFEHFTGYVENLEWNEI